MRQLALTRCVSPRRSTFGRRGCRRARQRKRVEPGTDRTKLGCHSAVTRPTRSRGRADGCGGLGRRAISRAWSTEHRPADVPANPTSQFTDGRPFHTPSALFPPSRHPLGRAFMAHPFRRSRWARRRRWVVVPAGVCTARRVRSSRRARRWQRGSRGCHLRPARWAR